jgi:hypothetical protein
MTECPFKDFSGKTRLKYFYFGVLHPVACTLSRLLEEPSLATTLQGVYFIFISPLHVSALAGHLQAEYTQLPENNSVFHLNMASEGRNI